MITNLLIKTFIKDDTDKTAVRNRYAMLSAGTGIAVNALLCLTKLIIGSISGSVAIIADALNNMSDAASLIITTIGIRLAGKHEDSKHPLGHGRMEYVTALLADIMIILVGVEMLRTAVGKIRIPQTPDVSAASFIILAAAIIIKLWMYFFYRKISIEIDSAVIRAFSLDSISDVAASFLVLISAGVSVFAGIQIDGWAGLLVAAFILYTGVRATMETVELLLGASPDAELVEEIYTFIKQYPEIIGIHDLMVHDYGPGRKFFTFHAEVPEDSNLLYAHEVIDRVEQDMQNHFGGIVTVHLDPIAVGNKKVDEMRRVAEEAAREIDSSFTIHDFRVTNNEKHMIFDLCIPTDSKYKDEEAAALVAECISRKYPKYHAVIRAEHPYI